MARASTPPATPRATSGASGPTGRRPEPNPARLALVGLEVALARAADRAEPVVRDVAEGGARRDPAVGIALGRVVDEPARGADEELLGAHGAASVATAAVRLAPCAS